MPALWVDVPTAWADAATAWQPLADAVTVAVSPAGAAWSIDEATVLVRTAMQVEALAASLEVAGPGVRLSVRGPAKTVTLTLTVQPAGIVADAPTRADVSTAFAAWTILPGTPVPTCRTGVATADLTARPLGLPTDATSPPVWRFVALLAAGSAFASPFGQDWRFFGGGCAGVRLVSAIPSGSRHDSPLPQHFRSVAAIRQPAKED